MMVTGTGNAIHAAFRDGFQAGIRCLEERLKVHVDGGEASAIRAAVEEAKSIGRELRP